MYSNNSNTFCTRVIPKQPAATVEGVTQRSCACVHTYDVCVCVVCCLRVIAEGWRGASLADGESESEREVRNAMTIGRAVGAVRWKRRGAEGIIPIQKTKLRLHCGEARAPSRSEYTSTRRR